MSGIRGTSIKVGIFTVVMLLLTGVLFAIFSQYRGGPDSRYSAIFDDASSLQSGDSVRVAGVRVGTVNSVALQPDNSVVVGFGADRNQLQQIAAIGGGTEFYAGGTPDEYSENLRHIFLTIGGLGTVVLVE